MAGFLRVVLLIVCLMTGLAAAFGAVQAALVPDERLEVAAVRVLAWLFVLGTSVATISGLVPRRRRLGMPHALAGSVLVALAAFALAWGVQVGLRTGDTEYPILLVESLVALQGGLTVVAVLLSPVFAGRTT